jgi:hypothetical protein
LGSGGTRHFLAEPHQGAANGHACRFGRWLVEHQRNLLVAVPQFDAGDDRPPVVAAQPLQTVLVSLAILLAHREIEGRTAAVDDPLVELARCRVARRVAKLIVYAVAKRAAEVAEQRPIALRGEGADVTQGVEHGVLHVVGGVGGVARPRRHAAVRPAVQPGQVAGQQPIQGAIVAGARAAQQFVGRWIRRRAARWSAA